MLSISRCIPSSSSRRKKSKTSSAYTGTWREQIFGKPRIVSRWWDKKQGADHASMWNTAHARAWHPTCLPFFPEVIKVTKLLLTFPVSVASAERSFSTLRRLKTGMRNTMGQKWLTALAVCNIHKRYVDNHDVNDLCDNFIRKTDERSKVFQKNTSIFLYSFW